MSDGQLAVAMESENLMINADDENTVENTDETNNNNNGNDMNDDVVVTSEQNEVSIDRTNLIINYLPNGLDETRLRVSKFLKIIFMYLYIKVIFYQCIIGTIQ